jgi:hypothetical protein
MWEHWSVKELWLAVGKRERRKPLDDGENLD